MIDYYYGQVFEWLDCDGQELFKMCGVARKPQVWIGGAFAGTLDMI
jgi:hypothetical protein